MTDTPQMQALHAAISLRSWYGVEVAANRLRDDAERERQSKALAAAPDHCGDAAAMITPPEPVGVTREVVLENLHYVRGQIGDECPVSRACLTEAIAFIKDKS